MISAGTLANTYPLFVPGLWHSWAPRHSKPACTRRSSRSGSVTRPSASLSTSTATCSPSTEMDAADWVAALILGVQPSACGSRNCRAVSGRV